MTPIAPPSPRKNHPADRARATKSASQPLLAANSVVCWYWDVCLPLALIAFLLLAIFGGQLAISLYFHVVSASWERMPTVVVGIENRLKGATLKYGYSYHGQDYAGERFQYLSSGTISEKEEINERFHKGQNLMIYVNPNKPEQSVVQRNALRLDHVGSHLFVIGFSVACLVYSFRRRACLIRTRVAQQPS